MASLHIDKEMAEITIRTDIYEYDKGFQAYKNGTTDEKNTLSANYCFLKSLQDQGFFSNADQPTVVGAMGCGKGDSIIKFLKDIQFKAGLDIRALDASPDISSDGSGTVDENAPVFRNLADAQKSQIIPLKSYRIKRGEMVQSDLSSLLFTEQERQQSKNRFDLAYFAHSLYFAPLSKILDKVFTDLISDNGIAILFHTNLKPDSNGSLSMHSLGMIADIVPTDEECKTLSMDRLVPASCQELGLTYFEIPYKSGLYFSSNFKNYVDIFKDINRYHEIRNNNEAIQDLYRLNFLCHRSLAEASADSSTRGWAHYVDFAADVIDKHGCINIFTTMYIILGQNVTPEVKQKVEAAVKHTQANAP